MADVLFAETEQLAALSQYSPSYRPELNDFLASVKFHVHGSDRWSYAVRCCSLVDSRVACELYFLPHSTVDNGTPGRLVLHDVVCLVVDIWGEETSLAISSWAIRFPPENAGSFTTLLCKACKEIALLNKLVFPASQVMCIYGHRRLIPQVIDVCAGYCVGRGAGLQRRHQGRPSRCSVRNIPFAFSTIKISFVFIAAGIRELSTCVSRSTRRIWSGLPPPLTPSSTCGSRCTRPRTFCDCSV